MSISAHVNTSTYLLKIYISDTVRGRLQYAEDAMYHQVCSVFRTHTNIPTIYLPYEPVAKLSIPNRSGELEKYDAFENVL